MICSLLSFIGFGFPVEPEVFTIKYDFLRNDLILEELIIDDKKNENILNFIRRFNQDNEVIENKVDLRNFFNSFIVEL